MTETLTSNHRESDRTSHAHRARRCLDQRVDARAATQRTAARGRHDRRRLVQGRRGEEFDAYFAGELSSFDLEMNALGTPFQRSVWSQLCEIPYGETISYGELAQRLGNPNASRAVGLANGRNPIAIIVPCHRVIGADGSLTGYGGGLERKTWLLEHERRHRS
jgi:O-6-methylguanine DNA methyltransferase